ncbi:MAG: lycopene cyclase domain-containing protein [Bacteroidota bacterium]|nr:lycopene cyclase domain-containing protein [Bacteroidota bacterium]
MLSYWFIDLILLLPCLAFSFHKKIAFTSKWKFLFPSIIVVYLFMLVWDHFFIEWGVWHFNSEYITGVFFYSIPIEEHLFFVSILFASVFVYECTYIFIKRDYLAHYSIGISITLSILFGWMFYLYYTKLYTGITCACAAFLLIQHKFVFRSHWRYMGRFYMSYLLMLVPVLITYWVLTSLPIVMYNEKERMGLQIKSIPVENLMYFLFQFLFAITVYEFFKKKFTKKISVSAEDIATN